jgi:hypothetical protein
VVALSGSLKEIEVLGRVEELECDNVIVDDAHVAIVVIDLLSTIETLDLAQFDQEGIGLAVVVGSHQRLLSWIVTMRSGSSSATTTRTRIPLISPA